MPEFSKKSRDLLATAHEDLQEIFGIVVKHKDCIILQGFRSAEAQQAAFDSGKSKAPPGKSPHNSSPSYAIDAAPYPIPDWNNPDPKVQAQVLKEFREFAIFVKGVAAGLGVDLTWGGDFKSFPDSPHFELTEWKAMKQAASKTQV